MPENKKAPEGAYGIEYALLCDRVVENNINGLDFIGVGYRFYMLGNQPVRKHLVIRMWSVRVNEEFGSPVHIGDLGITIFPTYSLDKTNPLEMLTKSVAWHHGFYVKAIQIPCAERGDYTIQILDDNVLMHSLNYSVI